MEVWIIETGEYEDRLTVGVASSLEMAVALIKNGYRFPSRVEWGVLTNDGNAERWSLAGNFQQVVGYHAGGISSYEFIRYEVDKLD